MTETIKVEVNEALARKFRKRAIELYGYKKGSVKRALEDTMRKFSTPGKVDWHAIRGVLKKHQNKLCVVAALGMVES
jgi:hypothetical protein